MAGDFHSEYSRRASKPVQPIFLFFIAKNDRWWIKVRVLIDNLARIMKKELGFILLEEFSIAKID